MKPTAGQYAKTLVSMMQDADDQEAVVTRFLAFLRQKRETKKLPAIIRALDAISETTSVDVVLAREAGRSREELTDLVRRILSRSAGDLRVHVEPKLLGGMIVRTRDAIWDGSVRSRIRRLKRALMS